MPAENEDRKRGDRRHLSTAELTFLTGVLFQAGVLVWGAAKLSSAVENLANTAAEMKVEQREQGNAIQGMRIDVTALKAKVDAR